jgi:hypothetical protein
MPCTNESREFSISSPSCGLSASVVGTCTECTG